MNTDVTNDVRRLLLDLRSIDFKNGFEDTVIQRVRDCIATHDQFLAKKFWSMACSGLYEELTTEIFNGDKNLTYLYCSVDKYARQNGFQMPTWGTRGT